MAKVHLVGVLALVHRDQRTQRGAHVVVDCAEEMAQRLVEVCAAFDLVETGGAHHQPGHRSAERLAGLDVGKAAVDSVEHRRTQGNAGVRCGHALDPECIDEWKHR